MGSLAIGEAAFAGFRLVREHLRALGVWLVLGVVVSLATAAIIQPFGGPQALLSAPPSPQTLMRAAPALAGVIVLSVLVNAIVQTAVNRALLRPAEQGFGFVRLGLDELRQLGVTVLIGAAVMACYLAILVILGIVLAATGQAPAVSGLGAAQGPAGAAFILAVILMIAVVAFLATRLSLAPALAFDRRRIDLRAAWAMTRGRFWPLLAVYVLTATMLAVVYVLFLMVATGLLTAVGLVQGAPDAAPAFADAAPFSPMGLVMAAMDGLLGAILWPVMFAPSAVVYRSLRAPPPPPSPAEGAPWGRA